VIDVGINSVDNAGAHGGKRLVGDVDYHEALEVYCCFVAAIHAQDRTGKRLLISPGPAPDLHAVTRLPGRSCLQSRLCRGASGP
jgi:hypothetical protein